MDAGSGLRELSVHGEPPKDLNGIITGKCLSVLYSPPHEGLNVVLESSKSEILQKGNIYTNRIRGVNLTIGIYSNYVDSIQLSPYAFKIFMPPTFGNEEYKYVSEIIHIRSDQKVQCQTSKFKNKYICLFALIVDDIDVNSNIVVLPRSKDGYKITSYGNFVSNEDIERNNMTEIKRYIETFYNNIDYKFKYDYNYTENINKTESFFFISVSEKATIIEVLSSSFFIFHNDLNLYPNPSTAQIFAISDFNVNLNFITTKELLLNIVGVAGLGQFNWTDENDALTSYNISGYGDRLSLTTTNSDMKNRFAPLKVKSLTLDYSEISGGFVFYITYYPRSNMDQLRININTEFHYRTVKMPLNYYAPITLFNSWSINFNFYDLTLKNNAELTYDTNKNNLFKIWATIITGKEAVKIREDPSKRPSYDPNTCVQGYFDSAFGTLYINSDAVEGKEDENPNLFFSIENNDNNINISSLGVELSIYSEYQTYGLNPIPEEVYLNGRLSYGDENKVVYKLQCDKNKAYLRVEFSAISDSIKFVLSVNADSVKNDDELKNLTQKSEWGRNLLTVYLDEVFFSKNDSIYLIIFTDKSNLDKKLDYFVFKYSLGQSEIDLIPPIEQIQSNVTYDVKEKLYTIMFYPIPYPDVSYFIKLIYKDGFIKGENINSIAISESKGKYLQITDPIFKENEKLYYNLQADKEVSYIKVMARFNLNTYKLFYLYTPINIQNSQNGGPDKSDENGGKNKVTLFTDRPQGGTGYLPGSVSLSLQRMSYGTDNKGLQENMREDESMRKDDFRTTHLVIFGNNINKIKDKANKYMESKTTLLNLVYNYMNKATILFEIKESKKDLDDKIKESNDLINNNINKYLTFSWDIRANYEIINNNLIIGQFFRYNNNIFNNKDLEVDDKKFGIISLNFEGDVKFKIFYDKTGINYKTKNEGGSKMFSNDILSLFKEPKNQSISLKNNEFVFIYFYFGN